jgi:16S rRNA (adenine1518-N6/adenine1519-N6)-dimethyltransferase
VSRSEVRAFLDRNGLLARKDLGQNFLVDDHVAGLLVDRAGIEPGDGVIEIGAGTGVLTRALAARASRVISLDVDAGLVRALRAESALPENVELIHQDVLKTDLSELASRFDGPVRLVSNLPYSISGPILRKLLDLRTQLTDWSVMVQREVGERLLAPPGTRDYGSLTVLHNLCVKVSREMELNPGGFFPAPKVRSLFLRLIPLADQRLATDELPHVERVVRAAFGQRRKTLLNGLRGGAELTSDTEALRAALARVGIDPRVRGETLSAEKFLELTRALVEPGPAPSD